MSRTGTIAPAAERLSVTSSPLSRTVRELERHLGRDLFVRKYHRFERTLAIDILAEADEQHEPPREPVPSLRAGETRGLRRS